MVRLLYYKLVTCIVVIEMCSVVVCQTTSCSNTTATFFPVKSTIDPGGSCIRDRFLPPPGYKWINEQPGSFGAYLQTFPLYPHGTSVIKYDGTPIENQTSHAAVLKLDVGDRDLQQCADAVMRLRAEYLFAAKRFSEIGFHFTSGHYVDWLSYSRGRRPQINGNYVRFVETTAKGDTNKQFRDYLNLIYSYAGTISLYKETIPVTADEQIKAGNILITPGSPGHVVLIAGKAANEKGEALYLLVQGYTPAQSVHVLANPFDPELHPWYKLRLSANVIQTAKYSFSPVFVRSFH